MTVLVSVAFDEVAPSGRMLFTPQIFWCGTRFAVPQLLPQNALAIIVHDAATTEFLCRPLLPLVESRGNQRDYYFLYSRFTIKHLAGTFYAPARGGTSPPLLPPLLPTCSCFIFIFFIFCSQKTQQHIHALAQESIHLNIRTTVRDETDRRSGCKRL